MRDDVGGGERRRRGISSGVDAARLRVARPHGGTDRGDGTEEMRELLREEDRAVTAHRRRRGRRPCAAPGRARAAAERDQLVHDHSHRVVAGMRVPIAAAPVDRDDRHRPKRRAVDLKRQGLRRRKSAHSARVISALPMEHDNERQAVARLVARRVRDRVPDIPIARVRVEPLGERRAWRREVERRMRDVAGAGDDVERLFPRAGRRARRARTASRRRRRACRLPPSRA